MDEKRRKELAEELAEELVRLDQDRVELAGVISEHLSALRARRKLCTNPADRDAWMAHIQMAESRLERVLHRSPSWAAETQLEQEATRSVLVKIDAALRAEPKPH